MISEIKYWHLRNHKLFSVLNKLQIEELCVIMNYKTCQKGDIIYFSNEAVKRIYFLKKGAIKIAEMDNKGNEVIKEMLQKGDLFGELAFDTAASTSEYAQAVSKEVVICSFKLEDFEKLLENYPSVALGYSKMVGFRFTKLKNNYSNLVFKDVKTRLIYFLIDWAEKEGVKKGDSYLLENYLTHQDIASLICSTRQTVTEIINEIDRTGLVAYSRKEISIKNLAQLRALTLKVE